MRVCIWTFTQHLERSPQKLWCMIIHVCQRVSLWPQRQDSNPIGLCIWISLLVAKLDNSKATVVRLLKWVCSKTALNLVAWNAEWKTCPPPSFKGLFPKRQMLYPCINFLLVCIDWPENRSLLRRITRLTGALTDGPDPINSFSDQIVQLLN